MRGYLDIENGNIWMDGKEWIDGPFGVDPMPMRDIEGIIDIENFIFEGDLTRNTNTEFFLEK